MTGEEILADELKTYFATSAGLSAGGLAKAMAAGLAKRLEAEGLAIYKKKVQRAKRRPPSSQPMTPALAAAIEHDWKSFPDMTQQEIAAKHKVNIGRVNEVVASL